MKSPAELAAPRAWIFDLDGTLIDSRATIAAACNHALTSHGHEALSVEAIGTMVGDGSRTLLERAFAETRGEPAPPTAIEEALATFLAYYEAHPLEGTRWMNHAEALIAAIRRTERPIAVVTNKAHAVAVKVLEAIGLRDVVLIGGGDGPLKPDPAPIRAAAAKMRAPCDASTWVVGDGTQDIEAGRAAGCTVIGVLGGFTSEARLAKARADALVPTLAPLVAVAAAGP